jgi:Ca-activated chloride channel family protein
MTWYNSLGQLEYLFIGCFLLFYLFYLIRMGLIAYRMKTSVIRVLIKFTVRAAYFALFIIALLNPTFGDVKKELKAVGKDIYIALDLSPSMNANDISPSRLEKAKYELKNMISHFSSDRIGLIIFTSQAFLQCPLTSDHQALLQFIETLHTDLIENKGTDFTPPLAMALEKHLLSETTEGINNRNAKVIILISDGENFGDKTLAAAQKIEMSKIKLFTLGIGTESGSKIPLKDGGFKRNEKKELVISSLQSKSLKTLAEITKGRYFEINKNINETEHLINTVNQIKGVIKEVRKADTSENKYFYFLLIALFLIIIDVMITVRVVKI